MENEKAYFFHTKEEKGKHRVTIAGLFKNGEFHLGAAACSPNDNFSKKIGRTIAKGRADKKPLKVMTLKPGDKINSRLIQLANEIIENPSIVNNI